MVRIIWNSLAVPDTTDKMKIQRKIPMTYIVYLYFLKVKFSR